MCQGLHLRALRLHSDEDNSKKLQSGEKQADRHIPSISLFSFLSFFFHNLSLYSFRSDEISVNIAFPYSVILNPSILKVTLVNSRHPPQLLSSTTFQKRVYYDSAYHFVEGPDSGDRGLATHGEPESACICFSPHIHCFSAHTAPIILQKDLENHCFNCMAHTSS